MTDAEIRRMFGASVRLARTELGIPQDALAREVGLRGRATISQIERGVNGATLPKALRLIEYLGLDVAEIVGGPSDE